MVGDYRGILLDKAEIIQIDLESKLRSEMILAHIMEKR